MKFLLFGLLFAVNLQWASAQETPTETLSFKNATELASHLRSEYGIAKAVYLTQVTDQLSKSFASNEQLQQQWQQALNTEIIEPFNYTKINSHALMAQSLIQHTNGMTLNRWRQINIPNKQVLISLDQTHANSSTFASWVNLNAHWHNLLNNQQANLRQWHPWLSELEEATEINSENTDSTSLALSFLEEELSVNANELNALSENINYFEPIAIALLRQHHHRENLEYLALAYDWIEIYQLLELSPKLLTADQQIKLADLLQKTTVFWQTSENEINLINETLFSLLNELITALPNKFKNPDHFDNALNNKVFSLITEIPNPSTYFAHPIRKEIQENLEVCLNLSVLQQPEPPVPINDNQFVSCLNDFITWGSNWSKGGELSGNLIKLDNLGSINRALDLPAPQITNHLAMQAAGAVECQQQLTTRSNWVEWTLAAETIAWFGDRWPALMASQPVEELLNPMFDAGNQIYANPDCVREADPINTQFLIVANKWERLKQEIISHVNQFKAERLRPNSDVDLFKSIDQTTKYIPENLEIGPCNSTPSCGAYVKLEPNTSTLDLFPNHLKLAEQFGLGQIEICYEDVHWVNRKTAPTHLDNNKIANFEGQLSFQLTGKYQGDPVFTKQFFSENSHIYLFGENNEDVLNTACPLPLVGTQINTSLDRGTFGLLPNRLTFLTASKIDINGVIKRNWTSWLNQLNNQETDFSYFDEMNAVKTTLNDAFLQQINDLQQEIYRKLIANNLARSNDSALSKATFDFITHRQLLDRMVAGLYPQLLAANPSLHAATKGQDKLVDMAYFRQSFQKQLNVADMLTKGDENFLKHTPAWSLAEFNEPIFHSTLMQLNAIENMILSDIKKDPEE